MGVITYQAYKVFLHQNSKNATEKSQIFLKMYKIRRGPPFDFQSALYSLNENEVYIEEKRLSRPASFYE